MTVFQEMVSPNQKYKMKITDNGQIMIKMADKIVWRSKKYIAQKNYMFTLSLKVIEKKNVSFTFKIGK